MYSYRRNSYYNLPTRVAAGARRYGMGAIRAAPYAIAAGYNAYKAYGAFTGSGAYRRNPARRSFYSRSGVSRAPPSRGYRQTGRRVYGSLFKGRGVSKQSGRRRPRAARSAAPMQPEKGMIEILHTEYVDDFYSQAITGMSKIDDYGINPGNAELFPWLSQIALQFQKYKFKQLMMEYVPLVSEATSTTAATLLSMGAVVMAIEYDAASPFYTAKNEMENSEGAVSSKPSSGCTIGVECKPQFNPLATLYVSSNTGITSSGISGGDVRLQNLGTFGIGSFGVPTASSTPVALGEIWVSYRCCLIAPILSNGAQILTAHLVSSGSGGATSGKPGTTAPFGGGVTPTIQPSLSTGSSLVGVTVAVDGTITFPTFISNGQYMLLYSVAGTMADLSYTGFTNPVNCTLLTSWANASANFSASQVGSSLPGYSSEQSLMMAGVVDILSPGSTSASIRLTTVVIPTNGWFDLWILQMNPNVI